MGTLNGGNENAFLNFLETRKVLKKGALLAKTCFSIGI
jgi:hypothetical protein